jgi:hypothetical protein
MRTIAEAATERASPACKHGCDRIPFGHDGAVFVIRNEVAGREREKIQIIICQQLSRGGPDNFSVSAEYKSLDFVPLIRPMQSLNQFNKCVFPFSGKTEISLR